MHGPRPTFGGCERPKAKSALGCETPNPAIHGFGERVGGLQVFQQSHVIMFLSEFYRLEVCLILCFTRRIS